MHANTTVTLRHETGREETIKNCRHVKHSDNNTIEVVQCIDGNIYKNEYDSLSWEVWAVQHTEIPPDSV